ncbi:hypothetical protein [Streptomyces sp. NPDC058758]|uniref:hypothetical protein n=1 Tax=Streptomyces sp. NPDC058758 TaxID=3346627 RepID=UPI0036B00908
MTIDKKTDATHMPDEENGMNWRNAPEFLPGEAFGDTGDSLGLSIVRDAFTFLEEPFEPAEVSDREVERRIAELFGEEFCEEVPESDRSAENGDVCTVLEFSLSQSALLACDEEDSVQEVPANPETRRWAEFFFYPEHSSVASSRRQHFVKFPDGDPRFPPRPTERPSKRFAPAAELDVHAVRSDATFYTWLSDSAVVTCRRFFDLHQPGSGRDHTWWSPTSGTGLERPPATEMLLVLLDSAPAELPRGKRCTGHTASGEYRWKEPAAGRRWAETLAELLDTGSGAATAEPTVVVLWLPHADRPKGGKGMALLVPLPQELLPMSEHRQSFEELWDSTLRQRLIGRIKESWSTSATVNSPF